MNGYETKDLKADHVRALLEEKHAAEVALEVAEEAGDDGRAKAAKASIKAVEAQLRAFGEGGSKPQASAEKRPAAAAEKR